LGVGAGLALAGRIPFACSFACFVVGRFETIRISVAYTNANVRIVGTHAGIAIGEDGYSQMGIEDIACVRALPNIGIVQPADELETKQVIAYAVEHQGPLYLRLTRQNLEPVCPPDYRFQYGRWLLLRRGHDVTLIGTGGPIFNCHEAAKRLETDGISAEVINAACIKPLDEELLLQSAGKTGHVVTVDDHSVAGGLGGAVAETLGDVLPTPLKRLGVQGFGESGDAKGLYAKHGLDPAGIAPAVHPRHRYVGQQQVDRARMRFTDPQGLHAALRIQEVVAQRYQNIPGQPPYQRLVVDEQNGFRTRGPRHRRLWRLGGFRHVGQAWKVDAERRALAPLAPDSEVALVLLDDAVHGRQAQARSLPDILRGEKRLEAVLLDLRRHAA